MTVNMAPLLLLKSISENLLYFAISNEKLFLIRKKGR